MCPSLGTHSFSCNLKNLEWVSFMREPSLPLGEARGSFEFLSLNGTEGWPGVPKAFLGGRIGKENPVGQAGRGCHRNVPAVKLCLLLWLNSVHPWKD